MKKDLIPEYSEIIAKSLQKTARRFYYPTLEGVSLTTLNELSKNTGVPITDIYRIISQGLRLCDFTATIEPKPNPKICDKIASRIRGQTQRYQRRPMFLDGATPKLTLTRIRELINQEKMRTSRIVLKPPTETPVDKKDNNKKQARWVEKSETAKFYPEDKFYQILQDTSRYAIQNPSTILERVYEASMADRPVNIGCFACLGISSKPSGADLPYVTVDVNQPGRILEPKISSVTKDLLKKLQSTGLNFTFTLALADTDLKDIYQSTDQLPQIEIFFQKLLSACKSTISSNINVAKWSEIQKPYQASYQARFDNLKTSIPELVGKQAIDDSVNRRLIYYRQQGIPITKKVREFARETATNLVCLYASQGPIINTVWDILAIADPDPTRFGRYQSLVTPELPIWYPYPG